MVAAHFIGLGEHDMHVLLTCEFRIVQRFEDAAARIAMGLYGLHDDAACRHRRLAATHVAVPRATAPTPNIMSHQSKAPPPPLLAGALTVSAAEALVELPPAGAVVSALAAMVSVKAPAAALLTLTVMEQLPFAGMMGAGHGHGAGGAGQCARRPHASGGGRRRRLNDQAARAPSR